MRRDLRHVLQGAALAVLAITCTLGSVLVSPELSSWLPGFDPAVERVYVTLLATLGSLVTVAASVAVGYREQRRHDVRRTYREFATAVGAGGAAVVVVAAILAIGVPPSTGVVSPVLLVLTLLSVLVSMPLVVVVAALAGVAVARLPTEWQRSDAPFASPLAVPVGAAVVAGGSVVVESGMLVLRSVSDGFGVPAGFPQFGSPGATLSIYSSADSLASGLLLVGGGVALGVYAARRYDFDESVRRFIVLVGVGSLVGTTAGPAILAAVTDSTLAGTFGAGSRWLFAWVASVTSAYVETALVVTLAAVAGLGIGAFEGESDRGGPTTTAAGAPSGGVAARNDADTPDDESRSEFSSADETAR